MARKSPFYDPQHSAFRETLRRFVAREITPHIDAWEECEEFPRELYRKAAAVGLLGLGFPEAYGGTEADGFYRVIAIEELARAGSGGLAAGLMSHSIGAPPILNLGSEAQKRRFLPGILGGEQICALAVTEPSGGSDVANLRTRARRDGDGWVLDGQKTFITSGMRADVITVAARTGGEGMEGISLFVVEGEAPGLARTAMKKMGWWCSDTATLYFEGCRVPSDALLGEENQGFLGIMQNFNAERMSLALMAYAFSQVCFEEAVAYARERETFGRRLARHQVIRHKLVDMKTRIEAVRANLELLTWRIDRGEWPIAEVCMAKNAATQCVEFCAKEAVQIFGGAGYMRGTMVERIYRETKVLAIGGGAEEIMKELAARQMGIP